VENLLPPGVGPHDYAFRPSDVRRLYGADVLVVNGLGLEEWLGSLLEAARRPDLVVIDTSRGIGPLPLVGEGEDARSWDPHIWLDPLRAIRQVENIRDGLKEADPDRAHLYEANAQEAIGRLRRLHEEIERGISGLGQRRMVTFHGAFQYFARRYGLEIVAVLQPAAGREPTPGQLARLHEVIRRNQIRVIYVEPQYRPRLAEVLARDLGLAIAVLDPGVTGPLSPDAYEEFMRRNLRVLLRHQGP
jgi:ABC-type Zn uptake system ZnuABC Zn-binding protein ZnuA